MRTKLLIIPLLTLLIVGCGDSKIIDGKHYDTHGIITMDARDPCIIYKPIVGNAILGFMFSASIVAPIYFFGFSLWEPVEKKPQCRQMPVSTSLKP